MMMMMMMMKRIVCISYNKYVMVKHIEWWTYSTQYVFRFISCPNEALTNYGPLCILYMLFFAQIVRIPLCLMTQKIKYRLMEHVAEPFCVVHRSYAHTYTHTYTLKISTKPKLDTIVAWKILRVKEWKYNFSLVQKIKIKSIITWKTEG